MPRPSPAAVDDALRTAARLAVRGHGRVEPNPMVGCVVLADDGAVLGSGYHRRLGGPHAEIEALARAGSRARGATLVVTLEPCAHHGRTPPCTDAITAAGIARVVFGTPDPNPVAAGGAEQLRSRGVAVERREPPIVQALNAPFVRRVLEERPWVSAKWAQTIDGAIAARSGRSRWISSPRMRSAVHRERGRVDAVITGAGTMLADDPCLLPRGVPVRRTPLRVVVDPRFEIPEGAALATTASAEAPVLVAVGDEALAAGRDKASRLRAAGVGFVPFDGAMRPLLRRLAVERGVSRVLVEAGGGLVGALAREGILDECWVVVAPRLAGDAEAMRPVRGFEPSEIDAMLRRRLAGCWRRGDEVLLLYR